MRKVLPLTLLTQRARLRVIYPPDIPDYPLRISLLLAISVRRIYAYILLGDV